MKSSVPQPDTMVDVTLPASPPRRRTLARRLLAAALVAAAVLGGCTTLELQQRKWIFRAVPAATSSPAEMAQFAQAHGMEDAWIEHHSTVSERSIRLHALWAPHEEPTAPVLLYLHGARRDLGANVYRVDHLRDLGFSVLAIDYRGFGNSTNELPSEQGAVEDAQAAWRWLAAALPGPRPLRLRLLARRRRRGAARVAARSGNGHGRRSAQGRGARIHLHLDEGHVPEPALGLAADHAADHRALRFAGGDRPPHTPLLVVHGSEDRFVPARFGQALYERAGAVKKRFLLVEGGTHFSTIGRGEDQYREALRDLFGLGS